MSAVLLVIPCFREKERLPRFLPGLCAALKAAPEVRIRVVDDGSEPEEQQWTAGYVEDLRREYPGLEPAQINDGNHGKGGAIYSAWDQPGDAGLLAFVDADGAVPADEVVRVLAKARSDPARAIYTVRTGTDGTRVVRDWNRKIAGLIFRWIVRRTFRFPVPDTQCGFKIIPAAVYPVIRPLLREMRFTFDVELTWHLLRQGIAIESVPINWTESPGSRLRPSSAAAMYRSIREIRQRLGDWRTAPAVP